MMNFWSIMDLNKPIDLAVLPLVLSILFINHVTAVKSKDTTEIFYDCEKYCHMDCEFIPENDPFHNEQCKAVHSHHSDCSCHFGGIAMGIYIIFGIFIIIILMVCVGRHCRRRRTVTNTRIVVVANPVPAEDIQNNNFQYQPNRENVYSIPLETKRTNYYPEISSDQEDQTTITVIPSRYSGQILDFEPSSPNSPSTRIYFENSSPINNERTNGRDFNEDQIFAPPKF